jgi:phosphoadenosine phosphosulfate reductase
MSLNEFVITDAGYIGEHNKVRTAVDLLREFEPMALSFDPRGYCICSSRGKDSRVLEALAQIAGVKYFILHNITGIDPPELVYFHREVTKEQRAAGITVVDQMYDESMWQLFMKKLIPPIRRIRYCCQELKERGGEGCLCGTGVRWAESNSRASGRNSFEVLGKGKAKILLNDNDDGRRQFEHCTSKGKFVINAIISWSDGDIWDFSKEYQTRQCCLYFKGFPRLGCVGCPQSGECQRRKEFAFWPGFERLWIYWFERVRQMRNEKGLKNDFKSGKDWFGWWLSDKAQEMPIEGQLEMFGDDL